MKTTVDFTPRFAVGDRVDARNGRGWTYDCTVSEPAVARRGKIMYTVETPAGLRLHFGEDALKPVPSNRPRFKAVPLPGR